MKKTADFERIHFEIENMNMNIRLFAIALYGTIECYKIWIEKRKIKKILKLIQN